MSSNHYDHHMAVTDFVAHVMMSIAASGSVTPTAGSNVQMLPAVAYGSRDSGGVGESYVYRGMAECSERR